MKNLRSIISLGVFTFVFTISLNAQTTEQTERATQQTERMQAELGLSAEQKNQVQQINLGIIMKNDAINEAEGMTKEEKANALHSNNEARKSMLSGVLTEAQMKKMEEVKITQPVQRPNALKMEKPVEKKATDNQ